MPKFIHEVAGAEEHALAQALARWTASLRAKLATLPIKQLVMGGSPMPLTWQLLDPRDTRTNLLQLTAPVLRAFRQAGERQATMGITAPAHLIRKASLTFGFDEVNPKTIDAATQLRDGLLRWFAQQQAEAIQTAVTSGLRSGLGPDRIARDVGLSLGLDARRAQAVINYRNMLEANSREALNRDLRDERYDPSVEGALRRGEPLPAEKIDQLTEAYHRNQMASRALTVARTETLRAANAGQDAAVRQLVDGGDVADMEVRRFWEFTHDSKTRPDHRHVPDLNPNGVAISEPFRYPGGRTIMLPGDPAADPDMTINCRCTVLHRLYPRRA